MSGAGLCAIFDVGKTNKKLLLFNEDYQVVEETSVRLPETTDEDGFPCEDVGRLTDWVKDSLAGLLMRHTVTAVNVSAYGASFVYVGEGGEPILPLYNYLKPFPRELQQAFDRRYGDQVHVETASPRLGSLNSGMQLFRVRYERSEEFSKIRYALHLPNFLSTVFGGLPCTEITSVGCHTLLWDFHRNDYHNWVKNEGLAGKFAPFRKATETTSVKFMGKDLLVGTGLHDSSAALVPYLLSFTDPFLLLSTGTWNIALNTFNRQPLTTGQLENDCLSYISYSGVPVKASRLHAGLLHEAALKLQPEEYNAALDRIADAQARAISLIDNGVPMLFVDGGFSGNDHFMRKLAERHPDKIVSAALLGQASALGAAMVIHDTWNTRPAPMGLIALKRY
jgi:sugar (pentulose or hexulose) kinase